MSALRLINDTTATTVSSLSITDVFSSDFKIYKIAIPSFKTSIVSAIGWRFINSSGSTVTTNNYFKATRVKRSYNTFQSDNVNANYFFQMGNSDGTNNSTTNIVWLYNPYQNSEWTFISQQNSDMTTSGQLGFSAIGVLKETTSITGLNLYSNAGGNFDINVKIYGLRIS